MTEQQKVQTVQSDIFMQTVDCASKGVFFLRGCKHPGCKQDMATRQKTRQVQSAKLQLKLCKLA